MAAVSAFTADRRRRSFTLRGLSRASGVSATTLMGLESGRRAPRAATLEKIATAYGCDLEEVRGLLDRGEIVIDNCEMSDKILTLDVIDECVKIAQQHQERS
jgi:transcriptional regulator with XRE-family HTH domain